MTDYAATRGSVDSIETLVLGSGAAGGIEAHFAPSAGMVGCSLLHGGEEVLGTRDGLRAYVDRHSTTGIPLLHPWANRLSRLEFELADETVNLDPDSPRVKLDENGLPIHGLLAAAPEWRVESHRADGAGARLRASYEFDRASGLTEAFPFPHRLEISAELRESALTVVTTVRATGGTPVPIAFGFHPYLRLPDLPRAEWEISVPVRDRILLDDRGLPSGEREPATVEPGALGERTFDDAFTSSGPEPFVLSGGGRRIELALLSGYPFAQLYAPPAQELIAFEPMTAPTNALVDAGPDLAVIGAGEDYSASFEIRVS